MIGIVNTIRMSFLKLFIIFKHHKPKYLYNVLKYYNSKTKYYILRKTIN